MPHHPPEKVLVLVLADQLSPWSTYWQRYVNANHCILMAEVRSETDYAPHHKQKLILIFSAMRKMAERLKAKGIHVRYTQLTDPENTHSIAGEIQRAIAAETISSVVMLEPAEYRLKDALMNMLNSLNIPGEMIEDDRFICSHNQFARWANGRKQLTMEYFYREMRKKTGYLMENNRPLNGQWNFDESNRKKLNKRSLIPSHPEQIADPLVDAVKKMVSQLFPHHPGDAEPYYWPIDEAGARAVLAIFIRERLPYFGDYQDAMVDSEPFLFHSLLSSSINLGLLDPREVCEAAIAAYQAGLAPLNCVEGFVRQIIGWREYIRGIYWQFMPGYQTRNVLQATHPLPAFFWDASTSMNCLAGAIGSTLQYGYAHHIHRLMIIGNFALLAGIDVTAVCNWYLGVYVDAYEWVELPNTLGMALYGDGGVVATKPYAGSGAYINRMSDYCKSCQYKPSEKTGVSACPFSTLYWDFMIRHQARFAGNRRMSMMLKNLQRISAEDQQAIQAQALYLRNNGYSTEGLA